jgi:hypothetical protein
MSRHQGRRIKSTPSIQSWHVQRINLNGDKRLNGFALARLNSEPHEIAEARTRIEHALFVLKQMRSGVE